VNLVPAISLAAAAVALHAAFIWHRLRAAPGWGYQRWFGLAAVSAAAYAVCAALSPSLPPAPLARVSALQLSLGVVQVYAWLRYADGLAGVRPGKLPRAARLAYLALAVPGLVAPSLIFDMGHIADRALAGGLLVYRDIRSTGFGSFAMAVAVLGIVPVVARFATAHRRGAPLARLHAVAVGVLLPVALSDLLSAGGLLPAPYLLDVGFVLPIAVVAVAVADRVVREAHELDELRRSLEAAVAERTRQLGQAQAALHEAERLAALGQFAGGIAHEVNNPAAAIAVNLRFIQDSADPGPNRVDVREAAAEGLQAMNRIVALVHRLAVAGRLAGKAEAGQSCEVADPVLRALGDVVARFPGGRVSFRAAPLTGVRVAAPEGDVHHAVQALLLNAAEAVPAARAGNVAVEVEPAGARVEVRVADDGVGLCDEVFARAFEPFFSTKPPGHGPGLGLTLAQAFARRHGGDVRLERRGGGGTRAVLVLPVDPVLRGTRDQRST